MSSRKIHFTWLLHEEIMLIKIREREEVEKMKKKKEELIQKMLIHFSPGYQESRKNIINILENVTMLSKYDIL